MCSGRVDLAHILRAFNQGADGVFIGGCRLGDCNYVTHGNYHALNLTLLAQRIFERIGLNPKRLKVSFMSGGEGNLFAAEVDGFCNTVKELGPIGQTDRISQEELAGPLAKVASLVPYIKIKKRDKMTVHLLNETDYENHFSLEEINQLIDDAVSYCIDPEKCEACMLCARSCPVDAIESGKSMIHVVDQDKCIKCGTCLNVCPTRFGAVYETSGAEVPPPLPPEKRKIVRMVSKKTGTI
jgi:coenzyme F420-reducing hydrogenase delta subunit/Fe-S-cluster-containing hydrogenase component 2